LSIEYYVDNDSHVNPTAGSTVAEISFGDQPEWVAINETGSKAYVTNAFNGTVSVIDMENKTVAETITVGAGAFFHRHRPSKRFGLYNQHRR
jgi:YVTN family beta-propeller protein